MARKKLTPHQRIMRAAARGTGLRLSADDCYYLGLDDAIATRALGDDDPGVEADDRTDDRKRRFPHSGGDKP